MAERPTRRNPLDGFFFAARGFVWTVRTQPNMVVHLLAAVVVIIGAILLPLSREEWCLVVLAIGLVMGAEALNSAIEALADAVHPEAHPLVGHAKDAAAAGVLLASIAAAVVGLIVFVPHVRVLLATP